MFSADLGGVTASSTPSSNDPPFQKVALLLHGDGTNGEQNNTFVDSSTNNFTITRTGNVAQGTFSPFSLAEGQWSNYFDGNGDYLTSSAPNLSGTWTVECWVYRTAGSVRQALGFFNNGSFSGVVIVINASNYIEVDDGNTAQAAFTGASVPINAWTHIAVVRNGTTTTGYVNGVSVGSNSFTPATTNSVSIGRYVSANPLIYTGYISNFRLVNGTAVYTSNFTPSTTPLTAITNTSLITCQSNRFKDNSSNNFTITRNGDAKVTAFSPFAPSAAYSASTNGGSGYFDGSGDYLSSASSAALSPGSGDFTIEAWIYPTASYSTYNAIYSPGLTTNGMYFGKVSGGIGIRAVNNVDIISATAPSINQWVHVAASRSGTDMRIFFNGVQQGSTVTNSTNFVTSAIYIGDDGAAGANWNGYISNLRFVKGTAVYTANFTPPTAPLTAITNTQLLLNCTNAGIIDNAGKNDIETVGNAQISTSVKKYGTGSMYFDGNGDYLKMPSSTEFGYGTGNFTIEFWTYVTSTANTPYWIDCRSTATASEAVPALYIYSGNYEYWVSGAARISGGSVPLNQWVHVALVRNGSTTTLYSNGTSTGTWSDSTSYISCPMIIGQRKDTTSQSLTGYIDDLRITKGQALYTSNFTPPTQAFSNV